MMRILLVEDEIKMSDAISYILVEHKYQVDAVYDGESAFNYGLRDIYDLIILDIMLPKRNGLDVLMGLREEDINTPIIMLSAKGEIDDKVKGLDYGADDYLAKPFESEELIARIRALTRRRQTPINDSLLVYGDLKLNPQTLLLEGNDKHFELTLKEAQVLEYLILNKNIIISKEMMIDKLWGYDDDVNDNTVEVYISFIRKKLLSLNSNVSIKTIRGLGYKLEVRE